MKLPGAGAWETFASGSQFTVPANSKFQLKVKVDTAYLLRVSLRRNEHCRRAGRWMNVAPSTFRKGLLRPERRSPLNDWTS